MARCRPSRGRASGTPLEMRSGRATDACQEGDGLCIEWQWMYEGGHLCNGCQEGDGRVCNLRWALNYARLHTRAS